MRRKNVLFGFAIGVLAMVALSWLAMPLQKSLWAKQLLAPVEQQLADEVAMTVDLSAQLEAAKANQPITAPPPSAPPAAAPTAKPMTDEEILARARELGMVDAAEPPAEPSPKPITITIPKDTGSREIASLLERAGIIDDAAAFDKYMSERGVARTMPYGEFELPGGDMAYADVLKALRGGKR